jgi:hypothetical protein
MSTLPFVAGDGIFALRLVGCACKDKVGCSRFSHLLPGLPLQGFLPFQSRRPLIIIHLRLRNPPLFDLLIAQPSSYLVSLEVDTKLTRNKIPQESLRRDQSLPSHRVSPFPPYVIGRSNFANLFVAQTRHTSTNQPSYPLVTSLDTLESIRALCLS